jgi:hypothetical protein
VSPKDDVSLDETELREADRTGSLVATS